MDDEIMDKISSIETLEFIKKDFRVPTRNVQELERKIVKWVIVGENGGCIWGRGRVGKSTAMEYIAEHLSEHLGTPIPTIVWTINEHVNTNRDFYRSLLRELHYETTQRDTAFTLRERLVNILSVLAHESRFQKVILFIDEAQQLSVEDFTRLMDLYNRLSQNNVLLTCFLFGTQELEGMVTQMKTEGKDQIVGRFMVHVEEFYGLRGIRELAYYMLALDEQKMVHEAVSKSSESILDFYFPNAGDRTFYSMTEDFWKALQTVRQENGIQREDIPMQYISHSINYCLLNCGSLSESPVEFPSFKDLKQAVEDAGYGNSNTRTQ